jgi:hypothetical protein
VRSELEVFEAAMRWIDFDKNHRIKYLNEVMKNVRFTLISPEELASKVETQLCEIDENGDIRTMLYNAFKFHALNVTHCSKLTNFLKKEECRNVCLKGASVPDDFVKAIIELSEIAHKLKKARKYTSYGIVDDYNSSAESLENLKKFSKKKANYTLHNHHHGRSYQTTCGDSYDSNTNNNNNNHIKNIDLTKN